MTAPSTSPPGPTGQLHTLRRGVTYRASTRHGVAVGEYLGLEIPHGTRSILLRHGRGTDSIAMRDVISIYPVAA